MVRVLQEHTEVIRNLDRTLLRFGLLLVSLQVNNLLQKVEDHFYVRPTGHNCVYFGLLAAIFVEYRRINFLIQKYFVELDCLLSLLLAY